MQHQQLVPPRSSLYKAIGDRLPIANDTGIQRHLDPSPARRMHSTNHATKRARPASAPDLVDAEVVGSSQLMSRTRRFAGRILHFVTPYLDFVCLVVLVVCFNVVHAFVFDASVPLLIRLWHALLFVASIEIPLLAIFYALIRFRGGVRWYWFPPLLLWLISYVYFDLFVKYLQHIPSLTDLYQIGDLTYVVGKSLVWAACVPYVIVVGTLAVRQSKAYYTESSTSFITVPWHWQNILSDSPRWTRIALSSSRAIICRR